MPVCLSVHPFLPVVVESPDRTVHPFLPVVIESPDHSLLRIDSQGHKLRFFMSTVCSFLLKYGPFVLCLARFSEAVLFVFVVGL